MPVTLLQKILAIRDLKAAERLILFLLVVSFGGKTEGHISYEQMSRKSDLSRRYIQRTLDALEKKKLIHREHVNDFYTGGNLPNIYRVIL